MERGGRGGGKSGVRVVVNRQNQLGEGPLWCPRDNVLYWLDIEGKSLCRLDPATNEIAEWATPHEFHALALRESQPGMIVTTRTGIGFFTHETGAFVKLHGPELELPDHWFNDGKCDRAGRFWAGSLDHREATASGTLYRIDTDGGRHAMETGIRASNGMAWSLDNEIMYYTDTAARSIYAYDFELESGAISNRRTLVDTSGLKGLPDGMTIDEEGYLWSAFAFGNAVYRFAPDGRLDRKVEIPATLTTSVMFGGADLSTPYITSGRHRIREDALAKYPLSGSLFALEPGVKGVPEPRFSG
jgi:L-arabinonolactonase